MPTQSLGQLPTTHNPHTNTDHESRKKKKAFTVRLFGWFQALVLQVFGLGVIVSKYIIIPLKSYSLKIYKKPRTCMQVHRIRMFTKLKHQAGLISLGAVKSTKACSRLAVAVMTCVGTDPGSFAAELQFSCSGSQLTKEQQGMSDWKMIFVAHNYMNCLMVQTFVSNSSASNLEKEKKKHLWIMNFPAGG